MLKGIRVIAVHLDAPTIFADILTRLFIKFGYDRDNLPITVKRNKFNAKIWSLIEGIGLILYLMLKIRLPMLLGYIICVDGGPIDILVTTRVYFTKDLRSVHCLVERVITSLRKCSIGIYLDTDVENSLIRRLKRASVYDQYLFIGKNLIKARKYAEAKLKFYRYLSREYGYIILNTSNTSPLSIHNKIIELLNL
jgi:hypothetical protein